MPITKIDKIGNRPMEKLPPNHKEFFAKKAADMKVLLSRNPVPDHLLKKKD
jgi:hypothetical protein